MIIAEKKGQPGKIWRMPSPDLEKQALFAKKLGVPLPVAQILLNRGINSLEEGEIFLQPSLSRLHSPLLLKDMDRAVESLFGALAKGRRIAVYGDYDVDGITATAILFSILQQLGGDVIFYLPDRLQEGYGLNNAALEYLKGQGVSLVVTVDCGSGGAAAVAYAREIGLEVIVTDHHQLPEVLPEATALINPLQKECPYPFKMLCGAGVAFKMGQALLAQKGDLESIWGYLDLVALGTVADVVPLVGENRSLVAAGLKQIESNPRPGVRALCLAAGLKGNKLTAEDVAFIIAPRLNAAGRLGDASRSFNLLLAKKDEDAAGLAAELQQENSRRQSLEQAILKEACSMADETIGAGRGENEKEGGASFLLLAREGWHTGVLGIVAGRMAEQYNRPVVLLSLEKGIGKGSGRSIASFDLFSALNQCYPLLLEFGGHRMAAGLTVKEACITLLREKLNYLASPAPGEAPQPSVLQVDLGLEPGEITPGLVRALEVLEPFGFGNEPPVFYGKAWFLEKRREVGNKLQHLQLGLQKDHRFFPGISFNGKRKLPTLTPFREIDLIFSLSFDRWKGGDHLQLEVYDCISYDEHSANNFTVIDVRGLNRKVPYIKNLISPGEAILVFVNTVARKAFLEKTFAGRPEVLFSHQGNLPAETCPAPKHVVLYDLPLGEEKLKKLLARFSQPAAGQTALQVHLVYNSKDFQENLKLLRATVPAFSTLEQVYFFLQKLIAGENAGKNISLNSLYSKLGKMLPFATTKHLLQKSMELLQEAAYLDLNDKEIFLKRRSDDYCALLKGISGTRGFPRERERWRQAFSSQHYLLAAPGEAILRSLSDFTPEAT